MIKKGILIAAFGSSTPEAQNSLRMFGSKVDAAFPGVPVRWAFTSGIIRERLADEGKKTDSAGKALRRMGFDRYTHVAVLSLLVVPGAEYHSLRRDATEVCSGHGALSGTVVSPPLLAPDGAPRRVAEALLAYLPSERTPEEAVVFMGHGSESMREEGDVYYRRLEEELRSRDERVFLGTMDGGFGIESVLDDLAASGCGRVWLVPLLAVAGGHALRDMAGSSPRSWKSRIEASGMKCVPVIRGMAEYEAVADIWISHLRAEITGLERPSPGLCRDQDY